MCIYSFSYLHHYCIPQPDSVVQSVARLTQKTEVPGSIPVRPHTFVSPSTDSRRAVYEYVHLHVALVNRSGGLSLPRNSVFMLTDRPDMTIAVYRGCKTTKQPYSLVAVIDWINERGISCWAFLLKVMSYSIQRNNWSN